MQRHERSEATLDSHQAPHSHDEAAAASRGVPQAAASQAAREVDWLALGVALLLSGFFALCGRVGPQPATSLVPVAVLSATGCGLLVTALRKLRTFQRPGLREAAIAGLFLALFQFVLVISYPNVLYALSQAADQRAGFLYTWLLVGGLCVLFSVIGAALGHLAFAPLRPLLAKMPALPTQREPAAEPIPADDACAAVPQEQAVEKEVAWEEAPAERGGAREEDEGDEGGGEEELEPPVRAAPAAPRWRPLAGYVIAVVLFGLIPTLAGYVFAAAFDFMLQANLYFTGPYPTLRLLSSLLPWQIPIPLTLAGKDPNSLAFLLWQFWRIPLLLGNPRIFDIQALEPYVFNAAALALLLTSARGAGAEAADFFKAPARRLPLLLLLLEICLGFVLVAPADVLIVRGLHGLLQNQILAVPIRTLDILNPLTFTLNLACGPLVCALIGVLLYACFKRSSHSRRSGSVAEK